MSCNNSISRVSSLPSYRCLYMYTETSKYLSTDVFILKSSWNDSFPEREFVYYSTECYV